MPAPYDTLESVLVMVRVRLLDSIVASGGDILTDSAPFTLPACNAGWRRLQEALAVLKFKRLQAEITWSNVPAAPNADPSSQVYISWNGYGLVGGGIIPTPILPADLIMPWKLWERPYNATSPAQMTEMESAENGLPSAPKLNWNRLYDWREDAIYLPGALMTSDIRMRYAAYLNDFTATSDAVPINRAGNALAFYICAELTKARADLDTDGFLTAAQQAAAQLAGIDPAVPKPEAV